MDESKGKGRSSSPERPLPARQTTTEMPENMKYMKDDGKDIAVPMNQSFMALLTSAASASRPFQVTQAQKKIKARKAAEEKKRAMYAETPCHRMGIREPRPGEEVMDVMDADDRYDFRDDIMIANEEKIRAQEEADAIRPKFVKEEKPEMDVQVAQTFGLEYVEDIIARMRSVCRILACTDISRLPLLATAKHCDARSSICD